MGGPLRILALALLLCACRASPASQSAGRTDQQGGAGGEETGPGGPCGSLPPPCFELEEAFLLPRLSRIAPLIRPVSGSGYLLVEDDPNGLLSLSIAQDGAPLSTAQLTDGPTGSWSGALGPGGFVVLLHGTHIFGSPELGNARILARFGDDGRLTWAHAVDPPILAYDVLVSLRSGDLLAFMALDLDAMGQPYNTYGLARWSSDGTPTGRAAVGQRLAMLGLLELADGKIVLVVENDGRSSLAKGNLDTGSSVLAAALPSLETRPLARLSTGGVWNSIALQHGGFAVGGSLVGHSRTGIGPGQPGEVWYETTDDQESYLAAFEGDGKLRWARRVRGPSYARVGGALADGGVVAQILADTATQMEVETGEGTFRGFSGQRALAVFGPKGDLRVLQVEPAPGGNEAELHYDPVSRTLIAQGFLSGSVVLGAGQPRETTLRPSPATDNQPAMAIYRYHDH